MVQAALAVLLFLLVYCFILQMATLLFRGETPNPSREISVNHKSASELTKDLEFFSCYLGVFLLLLWDDPCFVTNAYWAALGSKISE